MMMRSAMFSRTRCLLNPFHNVPFTLYGRLPQCVIHNSRPSTDGCVLHNVCSPLTSMRSERAHERTNVRTHEWTSNENVVCPNPCTWTDNNTTSAALPCSVPWTAKCDHRGQLTRCFSAVAELLVGTRSRQPNKPQVAYQYTDRLKTAKWNLLLCFQASAHWDFYICTAHYLCHPHYLHFRFGCLHFWWVSMQVRNISWSP